MSTQQPSGTNTQPSGTNVQPAENKKKKKRKWEVSWIELVVIPLVIVGLYQFWLWKGERHFNNFPAPTVPQPVPPADPNAPAPSAPPAASRTEEAARYGESFGYVNSLFSGFALAGVVAAIFYQRWELRLQREELRQTRRELKKSAKAQTQLVHLSALSTLLDAYLREYDINRMDYQRKYEAALIDEPNKVPSCLHYKILICRSELELIQFAASKKKIGEAADMSVEKLRFDYWITEYLRTGTSIFDRITTAINKCVDKGDPLIANWLGSDMENLPTFASFSNWDSATGYRPMLQHDFRTLRDDVHTFGRDFSLRPSIKTEWERLLNRAQVFIDALARTVNQRTITLQTFEEAVPNERTLDI